MVVMGNRGDLTNEQWERIEPLLPKGSTNRGRPAREHRRQVECGESWEIMPSVESVVSFDKVTKQFILHRDRPR